MNADTPPPLPPQQPLAVLPYAEPIAYGSEAAWREGNLLVVRKGAALPEQCIKCGAPAEGGPLKKTMSWHQPWLYILILFPGLLIYAIVALCVQKRATVCLSLCGAHRRRRRMLILTVWGLILGGVAGFFVGANVNNGLILLAGLVLFVAGLITAVAIQLVKARRIDDHFVWLRGAGPEFLAQFPGLVR